MKIERGLVHVYFAFDVGLAIDLAEADRYIVAEKERSRVKSKKQAGKYFDFVPGPLRIMQTCPEIEVASCFKTKSTAEALLFDFGTVSIRFKIPLSASFVDTLRLSEELYDNVILRNHARTVVEQILGEIAPAVSKMAVADHVEDYNIFQVEEFQPGNSVEDLLKSYPDAIASLLRADSSPLSNEEIQDAITHRISYEPTNVTLVDWNNAIIFGADAEDICAVLEFTNMALMEYSYLDQQLDNALEEFYKHFAKSRWDVFRPGFRSFRPELRKIGRFQIDSALLFEGVTNSLKLFGDVFLARLYRLSAKRLGLSDWDASINRKLRTVESIYEKIADAESTRRMEVLEWIIILLIAISIAIPFFPGLPGKMH